ncbi:hypothetical protein [Streptomyces sp. NPDC090798]|uniref:hypothetical protein n=1 Tax=Streptomyces sp. NPDC090798 TaxID=3365968 RepID=UPI0037FF6BF7
MAIYTCKKDGGGCGGRTIQIPDLEPLVEKLLFKRLEEVEVADEEDVNDPRPALEAKLVRDEKRKKELEGELLDGDRPAREIQNVIDKLNMRMADARRKRSGLPTCGTRTGSRSSGSDLVGNCDIREVGPFPPGASRGDG